MHSLWILRVGGFCLFWKKSCTSSVYLRGKCHTVSFLYVVNVSVRLPFFHFFFSLQKIPEIHTVPTHFNVWKSNSTLPESEGEKKTSKTVFCCAVKVCSGMCVFIYMIVLFLFESNHSMRVHHCNLTFQKDQHPTLRSWRERLQWLRIRSYNSVNF